MLETTDLCKKFWRQKAVDHVSLHIQKNSVYGLLGANGAGKSTILKMMTGILHPTSGAIAFNGKPWSMVDCPILFLTAKTLEEDILYGLDIGADDYITKPFRIPELRARIKAHLRREKRERHATLSFDKEVRFDLSAKMLYVLEQPVSLTKGEYAICEYLARNRGQVFSKEQIYEAVFGFDGIGDYTAISTHIKNIRAKLNTYHISPISTVWGIGYKWD